MSYRFAPFPDRGEIAYLRHRDLGDTVRAAFVFFRTNARPLLAGLFGIAGPVAVAVAIAMSSVMTRFRLVGPTIDSIETVEALESADWGALMPSLLVLFLGLLIVTYLGPLVAFGFVRLYREGTPNSEITISDVWASLQPQIWPVLSVAFLQFGAALGLMLLLVIPLFGWAAFLGLFVYLYPIFSVAFVVRVFECDSALDAFGRARELIHGRWGYAAGVVIIVTAIGLFFVMMCALPAAIWEGIVASVLADAGIGLVIASTAISQVLQLIGSLVASVFTTIGACFLFGSLKEGAEGSSLVAELEIFAKPEKSGAGDPGSETSVDSPVPRGRSPQHDDEGGQTPQRGAFRGGGFQE